MNAPAALLPPHLQTLVRAVHRHGRAGLEQLLAASGSSQPLTPAMLRRGLADLVERGWLDCVRTPTPQRPHALAWLPSAAALPWLRTPARLPAQSDGTPPADVPDLGAKGPLAPPPWRGTPGALYVPPPAAPMREGALDHQRIASRGLRC